LFKLFLTPNFPSYTTTTKKQHLINSVRPLDPKIQRAWWIDSMKRDCDG
jgi:hypothetical protein